jgi:D-arginine dehydrogenase
MAGAAMNDLTDVIILGGGMAGASLAAELAPHRRVVLVEVEDQPGRHATGRSAAMFFESYGNATVRALTRASRTFLEHPPTGFAAAPLLSPRSALFVCDAPRLTHLRALLAAPDAPASLRELGLEQALALCPILRPQWLGGAAIDDSGSDMDVAAIHQGYLRLARQAGAHIVLDAFEVAADRIASGWRVRSRVGEFTAPVLVNATGAWADVVARQAGVPAIGLQPMRRTAVTLPAPPDQDIASWPLVIDIDEQYYFKPDAGQLLLSPANEDPMDPCDVAPDEMDVAIAVDRFEAATTMSVRKLNHRWAGLRTFVVDRSPVAGFEAAAEGFFWLTGQGGYGIQMAPALARAAAALVMGSPLPDDIAAQGVSAQDLSPSRPTLRSKG